METLVYRKIIVTQAESCVALSGPRQLSFETDDQFKVSIFQHGIRSVEIAFADLVPCDKLFSEFLKIEKLLMLLDGRFYSLKEIDFSDGVQGNNDKTDKYVNDIREHRLGFYSSKDFCKYSFIKLINFDDVLNSDVYAKWKDLLEQMDIAYQVFLYALADNKNPVDMNFAFLVELAEPFVELIKDNTYYCQTLYPGERGTTLKMCVDSLITLFGTDIFEKELCANYKDFLDNTIGSRIRVMHIKKNQNKYWQGKDCVRYSMKFSILYRRILLEILGIKYDKYKEALINAVQKIDRI